jgi:hypothetical protein
VNFFIVFPKSGLRIRCASLEQANARRAGFRKRNVDCFVEARS